jgi:hypothetical protein
MLLFFTYNAGPALISQTDGCYWMEGIALTNLTFSNNVIRGVNQGVAGEAADVFIGNSVPVRTSFQLCCPPPRNTCRLNHSLGDRRCQVFDHGQPSPQCAAVSSSNLNSNLIFANNSHAQSHVNGRAPAAVLFLSSNGVRVEGNVLTTDGPLAPCKCIAASCGRLLLLLPLGFAITSALFPPKIN